MVCRIVLADAACSIIPAPTSGSTASDTTACARTRSDQPATLSIVVAATITLPRPTIVWRDAR
jgi:hypothetical protein